MPIVYLIAGMAGLVALALLAPRPYASTPATVADGTTAPNDPSASPSPLPSPAPDATPPPSEPADEVLRTPDGLRRKVLVRELNRIATAAPDGGRPAAGLPAPLDYFSIWFVREEKDGAVRIGPALGPASGWVPSSSVVEWDTRLMARPTPRDGRPPLVLYRDRSCLLDALAGRACPSHGASCPVEGGESEASTPDDADDALVGFPVLAAEVIPRPDGSTLSLFEVASLVEDLRPPPPPRTPLASDLADLRAVDVAFVIDTTASMGGWIEATRSLAADLATEAARRDPDIRLRLALIEYRDTAAAFGFAARITVPFTSPVFFRRALTGVNAARGGDGSVAERVLDGVALALPSPSGLPALTNRLDWPTGRAGTLATKMIVLVGDAPDHDASLARAEALAARARDAGISIAVVTIPRPDRSRDEDERYRSQWKTLAEGAFRPLDSGRNFAEPIEPLVLPLDRPEALASAVRMILDDRFEHARSLAALAAAEAEGRLEAYTTSQGITLDRVYPVLEALGRTPPRPDPRDDLRRAPGVRRGWIAENQDGHPMVRLELLLSRPELDRLITELLGMQQAIDSGARDLSDLLRVGAAAAVGESSFLATDRGRLTFADHLRRLQGLPPGRPDSLLRRTQMDLVQADEPTREALRQRLRTAIDRLVRRRADPAWTDPKRSLDGQATIPYEWIDL
jgi:hypothetical protein